MFDARTFALAGLLAIANEGCSASPRTKVPPGGISLRYALEAGDRYYGRVLAGSTRQVAGGSALDQSLEYEVLLEVKQNRSDGQRIVQATLDDVDLDWSLPATASEANADFHRNTVRALQGMTITFIVDQRGRVVEMPGAPSEASGELKAVAQHAIDALESAFIEVPQRPVQVDETWASTSSAQEAMARFVGVFKADDGTPITRIEHREHGQRPVAPGRPAAQSSRQQIVELTIEGRLHRADAQSRYLDPVHGAALSRTRIDWRTAPPSGGGG